MARGFHVEPTYTLHTVDSINNLNGILIERFTLGLTLKLNGTLKYQFSLDYISNIWDYFPWSAISFGSVNDFTGLAEGGAANTSGMESIPAQFMNAGLGWRVSLGDLTPGSIATAALGAYVSSDGALHPVKHQLAPPPDY